MLSDLSVKRPVFAAVAAINLLKYKGVFDIGFWII